VYINNKKWGRYMYSTNFQQSTVTQQHFREFVVTRKEQLTRLITELQANNLVSHAAADSFKKYPFALTQDTESLMPEIHSTRYMKYIMQQKNIAISHTDALWLHRIGVPMISPFSLGVEAITMSMAFGILLPIFEEHFTKDPAQVFALLLVSCLVVYPLVYKLASALYSKRNPRQRDFPDYHWQDLMNEGFRLFTVLTCALVGLDLFELPLEKAAIGAGIAVPLLEIFNKLPSLTEWTPTIFWETLRSIFTTTAIFGPLMYILNSLPRWLPTIVTVAPWLSMINAATIALMLPTYARVVGTISFKLTNYFYDWHTPAAVLSHDRQPLLAGDGSDQV